MFDAKQLCDDYSIDYAHGGKHFRPGWVNTVCCFCHGHTGYHLGINIKDSYANCHRCGSHSLVKVIASLTNSNWNTAKDIIKKYSTVSEALSQRDSKKLIPSQLILPSGTISLTPKAKKYLVNRKFDPDKLAHTWELLSTPHWGFYKHRILAPIYFKNQLVSYQCRNITEKHSQKYLACHQDEEIIQHQHTIYAIDQAVTHGKTALVCEGITDIWRMGIGSICTFGIDFTKQQARLIAANFNRVFILFDSEDQAQEKADELGFLISSAFTNPVEVINLPFLVSDIDPGEMKQDDADALMKEIGLF